MGEDKSKDNKKKTGCGLAVLACIIAVAMIICVQVAGTYLNLRSILRREASSNLSSGLQLTLDQLAFSLDEASARDRKAVLADVALRAVSLRETKKGDDLMKDSVDNYGRTYVVKVEDGKVILPEGAEIYSELTADALKGEQGIIEAADEADWRYFIAFSSIGNGYYVVKEEYTSEGADNLAAILLYEMEAAFGGKAILLDEEGRYIYNSTESEAPDLHGSNGLDSEALNAFLEQRAPYYAMAKSPDNRYTLIFFLSRATVMSDSFSVVLLVTLVAVILAAVLIVWIIEIRKLIISGTAGKEQLKKYDPPVLRRRILTFCILAAVTILLSGMFSRAIGSLYSITWDSQNTLAAVEKMVEDQDYMVGIKKDDLKEKASEHARIIADAIYRDPQLRTKKQLGVFSNLLSANYIMLYDSDGREILTDSPYINMNIGGLSHSDMQAFRRVLNGGSEAYLEDVTDNVTGEKSDLIGVRMPSVSGDEGGYNLLVISYPPAVKRGLSLFPESVDLVASLITSYNGYMLLDENGIIRYMTDKDLYGRDPLKLGMEESEMRDSFIGEFYLDNDRYYGAANEIKGELYYYITKSTVLHQGTILFGLFEAAGFILVLLVLVRILMKDYDKIYEEGMAEENRSGARASAGSSGWFSNVSWIRNIDTPEAKAKTVLSFMGGLCILIIGMITITSASADHRDSLIPYVFSDNWNRGLNLFAAARIIFMICGVALVWSLVSFIINVAVDMLDTRGATVAKLLKSVLSYVVVVFVLYYSALYLGFDPATLLASIGIIGLAVSLGVKDIIADVFSGVSLIFEKAFQVGDIVMIDGTVRGTVRELGVRTIKLLGDDNNLKVIRYSDIHKIDNLSRNSSLFTVEFTVKNNVDTAELKRILDEELPKIREKHRDILSDPVFTGISSINTGSITFGVRAECKEARIRKVRSILNYEIRDLIKRNGIEMP